MPWAGNLGAALGPAPNPQRQPDPLASFLQSLDARDAARENPAGAQGQQPTRALTEDELMRDPGYRQFRMQEAAAKQGVDLKDLTRFGKTEDTSVGAHVGIPRSGELSDKHKTEAEAAYRALPLLAPYNETKIVNGEEVRTGVIRRKTAASLSGAHDDPELKIRGVGGYIHGAIDGAEATGRDVAGLGLRGLQALGAVSPETVKANAEQALVDRLDANNNSVIGNALGTLGAGAAMAIPAAAAAGALGAPAGVAGAAAAAAGMGLPGAGEAVNTATLNNESAGQTATDAAIAGLGNTALGLITGGTGPRALRAATSMLPASVQARIMARNPRLLGAAATGTLMGAGGAALQEGEHLVDPQTFDAPSPGSVATNAILGAGIGAWHNGPRNPVFPVAGPPVPPEFLQSRGTPVPTPEAPVPEAATPTAPTPEAPAEAAPATAAPAEGIAEGAPAEAQQPASLEDWFRNGAIPREGMPANDGAPVPPATSNIDLAALMQDVPAAEAPIGEPANTNNRDRIAMTPDELDAIHGGVEQFSPESGEPIAAPANENELAAQDTPAEPTLPERHAEVETAKALHEDANDLIAQLTPHEAVQYRTALRDNIRDLQEAVRNGGVTRNQQVIDLDDARAQVRTNARLLQSIDAHLERLRDHVEEQTKEQTGTKSYRVPEQMTFDDLLNTRPEPAANPAIPEIDQSRGANRPNGPRTVALSRRAYDELLRAPDRTRLPEVPEGASAREVSTAARRASAAYGRIAENVRHILRATGHPTTDLSRLRPLARVSDADLTRLANNAKGDMRLATSVELAARQIEDNENPTRKAFMRKVLASLPGMSDRDLSRMKSNPEVAETGKSPFNHVVDAAVEAEQYKRQTDSVTGKEPSHPKDINYEDCL